MGSMFTMHYTRWYLHVCFVLQKLDAQISVNSTSSQVAFILGQLHNREIEMEMEREGGGGGNNTTV